MKKVDMQNSALDEKCQLMRRQLAARAVVDKRRREYGRNRFRQKPAAWQPLPTAELAELIRRFEGADEIVCWGDVRGVFVDIAIAEYRLRLHALVCPRETFLGSQLDEGLSLLLILGPIANSYLPIGTELTVTENNLLNSGQSLCWTSQPACLYTQVFGDCANQFTVRIKLPNGGSVTLSSLTFLHPWKDDHP